MIRNLKNSFLNFKTVSPQVNKTFSVYTDYLNPEKHIYMSHNPDNIYQDIYQIGEYPMPQRLMIKEISKVYIPQIRTLVFDHLQKIYPNAKLDSKDYENFKFRSWKKQGVTDFDAVKNEILEILANNIFVKENKFRYPIEQKNRLNKTNYIFNRIDLNDYFIDYFIDCYNLLIKIDIDRSNLWQSPKIRGQTNFLEQYMLENQKALTGITDLKKEIPENRNFINRLMEKLHTI